MTDMKNHVFGKRLDRVQGVLDVHVQTEVTQEFQYTANNWEPGTACLLNLSEPQYLIFFLLLLIHERFKKYHINAAGQKSVTSTNKSLLKSTF